MTHSRLFLSVFFVLLTLPYLACASGHGSGSTLIISSTNDHNSPPPEPHVGSWLPDSLQRPVEVQFAPHDPTMPQGACFVGMGFHVGQLWSELIWTTSVTLNAEQSQSLYLPTPESLRQIDAPRDYEHGWRRARPSYPDASKAVRPLDDEGVLMTVCRLDGHEYTSSYMVGIQEHRLITCRVVMEQLLGTDDPYPVVECIWAE